MPVTSRPFALTLLAGALGAAAEGLASVALFAVAVGLALVITFAGVVVALAAHRLTVTRLVSEREAHERHPIRLRFDVRGVEWLPVVLQARDQSGVWVTLNSGGATVELAVPRRGAYRLLASQLRLRDALGVFELGVAAGHEERLLILPLPDLAAGTYRNGGSVLDDDKELDGLRPYTPGAPLGRIDWNALARGVGLQVRHFTPGLNALPLVVVDTTGEPGPRALDWAARTAAGFVLALARQGGCRVLLPGDKAETSITDVDGEWRAIHRRLATLGPSGMRTGLTPATLATAIRVQADLAPEQTNRVPALPPNVVAVGTQAT